EAALRVQACAPGDLDGLLVVELRLLGQRRNEREVVRARAVGVLRGRVHHVQRVFHHARISVPVASIFGSASGVVIMTVFVVIVIIVGYFAVCTIVAAGYGARESEARESRKKRTLKRGFLFAISL